MSHKASSRISLIQIQLNPIIVVPNSIEQLPFEAFLGDPGLVERISFEPGSRLRVLGDSVFSHCGPHCADLRPESSDYLMMGEPEELAPQTARLRARISRFVGPTVPLQSLCIPASVEEIGVNCFRASTCVSFLTFAPGSQLRVLGQSAFEDSVIETVEIPRWVTVIPKSCFAHCAMLSKVTFLPRSRLRQIEDSAFAHAGIESIEIPLLVEEFGTSAFAYCVRLSKIVFEADCPLRCLGDNAMFHCTSLQKICIPAAVESLGLFCLSDCDLLETVTFKSGSKLAELGYQALSYCQNLGPSIHLPSSLKAIPEHCFLCSRALQRITFEAHSALNDIQMRAFRSCSLQSFCVPSSCLRIHWSCFENNAQLVVTFESPARIREILGFDSTNAKQAGTEFELPDSLEVLRLHQIVDRGFVYRFERNSQLRELSAEGWARIRFGFMRVSERSLKLIRSQIEFEKKSLEMACSNETEE
jgi:hypothetical protein